MSPKQKQIQTWWRPESPVKDKDIIFVDGSIRSGKTLNMGTSYVLWAMENFNGYLFGIAGKTIGSCRKNVLTDLFKVLNGRGFSVKENRIDNTFIVTRGKSSNTFEVFGGKDEGSQALIQGRTLAGMLFDEAALMPESFINQAVGRCSIEGSKLWFNCNPASPFHFLKTEYLDKIEKKNIFHIHFTQDDNLTLSEKIKKRYREQYSGLFYQRFILGLWVLADGVIYDSFNPDIHLKPKTEKDFKNFIVGVDYGTSNPTVFLLIGYNSEDDIHVLREYYFDSRKKNVQKTDAEYTAELMKFLKGVPYKNIYIDPSAKSFSVALTQAGFRIKEAQNAVLDGIRFVSSKLKQIQITFSKECKNLIGEMSTYCWDSKKQKIGEDKPIKEYDHAMDALRYAIYTHFGGKKYKTRTQRFVSYGKI